MLKGVALVITYHPLLKCIGKIMQNHLYMGTEVKKMFSSAPIVSFKGDCKLRSSLVRARSYLVNCTH